MPNLMELVRSASISPRELIEVLGSLAFGGRDFGFVEASQVIALFDRCSPAMTKEDYIQVRDRCREGSRGLQGSGKANAAREYAQVADAAEAKAAKMP